MSEIGRVTRSKQNAQHTYDRISRWYDILEGSWEKDLREAALQRLSVQAGETVLEIGFGPGHDLLAIARLVGESGKVFGIDLSPCMCEIARRKLVDHDLAPQVTLQCGDAIQLPYEPALFDAVFMSFTLELFDTPESPWYWPNAAVC